MFGIREMSLPLLAVVLSASFSDTWPSFRGEFARGVADNQHLPEQWDVGSGKNIRWSLEVPGSSHSSPVVADGKVFVISAVTKASTELVLGDDGGTAMAKEKNVEFAWHLFSIDAESGTVLWDKTAYQGKPRAARHVKASQANATPATDGETVVAIFGSQGLVAYDYSGKELWRKDLGVLDPGWFGDSSSHWGHASSPVIDAGRVFVQVDRHENSYIAAYNLGTGKQLWKIKRAEKPVWATPTIHHGDDGTQLIVLGGDFDRGLDAATGKERWRYARDLEVKTPTPFVAGDLVILSGGNRGREVMALSAKSQGVVSKEGLAWMSEAGGPYTSTPVAYGDHLFFVRDTGVFNVLAISTGERVLRERTDSTFSASPVASDGRIFMASEDGTVHVRSASEPFSEIARNDMGQPCMSSPAIADGTLFLRCGSTLWAVSSSAPSAASSNVKSAN